MRVLMADKIKRADLQLDESKPTILVVSDTPGVHTGLAQIVRNVWGPIHKTGRFNIVQLAWWHQNPVEQAEWTIIATARNHQGMLDPTDKFGNATLNRVLTAVQPNLVWVSGDPWMSLPVMSRRPVISGPIVGYFAVDGGPLDPFDYTTAHTLGWKEAVDGCDMVVPYLPWGYKLIKHSFPDAPLHDPIPLGVNTELYKPLDEKERKEIRTDWLQLHPDEKVYMSVSRNQFRKGLPENFRALYFLRTGRYNVCYHCGRYNFHKRDFMLMADFGPRKKCKFCGSANLIPGTKRDKLSYYCHAPLDEHIKEDSYRLQAMLRQFDFVSDDDMNAILINGDLRSTRGIPEPDMAKLYAAADCFALPSLGEGFGVPYLEALACGTPVVASDFSAHPDFLRGVASLVDCPNTVCEPSTNYWRGLVDPEAWMQAIDKTCYDPDPEIREKSRERALEYDWANIWPQWLELFDSLLKDKGSVKVWRQPLVGV